MKILEVFWTKFALNELSNIYKYYRLNVGSSIASKIKDELIKVSQQLSEYQLSGVEEEYLRELKQGHRYIVRGKFKIIYKVYRDRIYITDVFDSRQNPQKIKNRNV